jgi:L-amino acid N-acyltransferase YncA
MRYRLLKDSEWSDYETLFKKIFGYWDSNQRPHYVILAEREDGVIGFVSLTRTHVDTCYLQYAGILKEDRGKQQWNLLEGALNEFKKIGVKYVVARVHNKNHASLIVALKMGWTVIGFRSTTEDKSLVEIIKEI